MRTLISLTFFIFFMGMSSLSHAQDTQLNFFTDPEWEKYPFKPGDGLMISTLPDTTSFINGVYPIDDRGFAELPMIGKVNVSKMTVHQLVAFLRKNYESYLRFPNIYVKPLARVSLLGGFTRPGLYYVDVNSSLWDLIYMAGGTLTEDGIYEMHWQRNEKERSGDLTGFFESGISLKKMGFKSGDIFWTPSPTRRTFWDKVRDVMPILTFATTVWAIYNTYQRDILILRSR
ncbi:polysaccharide export protein [Caldithrix abyssi DSM 13497]|uniref:Polysaccharide export protein n=2 Tax=Caldithrix abyssi DSM 13497 TaxID=880073 RepID=H1XXC1_CALAY|nr:polysaccharide biosynthesis/export family protein [Caldithrix abyssi]EHO41906.1 polysaccharide export protein [Caldithrix abyssi DSM 13497]